MGRRTLFARTTVPFPSLFIFPVLHFLDLKFLILAALEGSKIRSRVLLLEGEKATRFFFRA